MSLLSIATLVSDRINVFSGSSLDIEDTDSFTLFRSDGELAIETRPGGWFGSSERGNGASGVNPSGSGLKLGRNVTGYLRANKSTRSSSRLSWETSSGSNPIFSDCKVEERRITTSKFSSIRTKPFWATLSWPEEPRACRRLFVWVTFARFCLPANMVADFWDIAYGLGVAEVVAGSTVVIRMMPIFLIENKEATGKLWTTGLFDWKGSFGKPVKITR